MPRTPKLELESTAVDQATLGSKVRIDHCTGWVHIEKRSLVGRRMLPVRVWHMLCALQSFRGRVILCSRARIV